MENGSVDDDEECELDLSDEAIVDKNDFKMGRGESKEDEDKIKEMNSKDFNYRQVKQRRLAFTRCYSLGVS